jgi:hypothetical protein
VLDPFSRYVPLLIEVRCDDTLKDGWGKQIAPRSDVTEIRRFMSTRVPAVKRRMVVESPDSMRIWQAANAGTGSMTIRGIHLRNPKVLQSPSPLEETLESRMGTLGIKETGERLLVTASTRITPQATPSSTALPIVAAPSSLPPSQGFVVIGDIELFGVSDAKAQLEIWEGPAPDGITVQPNEPPSIERASITGDLHLSSIIPLLSGSKFDRITFRNIVVYHQNYPFDETKPIGWHFSADWVIDDSAGSLHQVLSKVLNIEEPVLTVSMGLGQTGEWNQPPSLDSFTLEGVFSGIDITPIDGIHFTTIGVRLSGVSSIQDKSTPRTPMEFAFSVFGNLNLSIAESAVPLELEYEIKADEETLQISAGVPEDVWYDAFGVTGLDVSTTDSVIKI